jgi:hypothetical protein
MLCFGTKGPQGQNPRSFFAFPKARANRAGLSCFRTPNSDGPRRPVRLCAYERNEQWQRNGKKRECSQCATIYWTYGGGAGEIGTKSPSSRLLLRRRPHHHARRPRRFRRNGRPLLRLLRRWLPRVPRAPFIGAGSRPKRPQRMRFHCSGHRAPAPCHNYAIH